VQVGATQPRCPPDTRGVTVLCLKDLRVDRAREGVVQNLTSQSAIDLGHIAHAATQDDATGV